MSISAYNYRDRRATIRKETKEVSVAFDVTSASSLAEFTICDGTNIRIQGPFTRTLWYNCHWYFDIGLY